MLQTRWRPQPTSGAHAHSVQEAFAAEWEIVLSGRANVLLEGSKSAIEATIDQLVVDISRPVVCWSVLHDAPDFAHTLVVEELANLSDAEQSRLVEIESRRAAVQIVSTSSTMRAYDAVRLGRFRADLYYRLNTIRIQVD